MPIKPENKYLYPSNWSTIRARILERAHDRCEFCDLHNHSIVYRSKKPTTVVLTIAHLDHDPRNCHPDNLRALCQLCHISLDKKDAARARKRKRAIRDLFPEPL